jgi:hypothetical protein
MPSFPQMNFKGSNNTISSINPCGNYLKGTVPPDLICLEVVWLSGPWLGHNMLVFSILINFEKIGLFEVLSKPILNAYRSLLFLGRQLWLTMAAF